MDMTTRSGSCGMQVVGLTEGRHLGWVEQVYLSPGQRRVVGLQLTSVAHAGSHNWLDAKDVELVGQDVLFVGRAAACKAKNPVGLRLKECVGLPVLTRDGKKLGSLVDLVLDDEWTVVQLVLSSERVVSIDPRWVVFGPDAVVLSEEDAADVRLASALGEGILSRLFGIRAIQEISSAVARAERHTAREPGGTDSMPARSPDAKKKSHARRGKTRPADSSQA